MANFDENEIFQSLLLLYAKKDYKKCLIELNKLNLNAPLSAKLMNLKSMCQLAIGDIKKAEISIRKAIEIDTLYAQAYSNLGVIQNKKGSYDEAIESFKRAIKINKNDSNTHFNLGSVHKEIGNYEEAIRHFNIAKKLNPGNFNVLINLGNILKELDRYEESILCYEEAIAIKPKNYLAYFNLGLVLKIIGKTEDAIKNYKLALNHNDRNGAIYRNLSLISKFAKNDPIILKMLDLSIDPLIGDQEKSEIFFALGKTFEDFQEYEKSFEYFKKGNYLRSQILKYSSVQDQNLFEDIKRLYSSLKNVNIHEVDKKNFNIVFVVGMPRSGTSLIEQVISSHSEVYGAGELNYLDKLYKKIFYKNFSPSSNDLVFLRNEYFKKASDLITDKKFLTDKMPHNFRYLGIIKKSLPEAKIIFVKRDAKATCWSNFKHYFTAKGLGYSYNLTDLVSFYKLFEDLMNFWKNEFGETILEVHYESLVRDKEVEIRKIINFLGLSWEENCLEPHNNKRHVLTASNQQVKKQIYSGSSDEWKKYELSLGEYFSDL